MLDWHQLVEERLRGLTLEPEEKAEVVAELSAHLEDICDAMPRRGVTDEEAVEQALSQVGSWQDLQNGVLATKRRGHFMRNRIRQLWFPGLFTLFLSTTLLIVLQSSGFRPIVIGNGADTVLFYWQWLVLLPLLGAFGAYISLRAGGSTVSVLLVSAFPAAALATAFLLMLPIGVAVELAMQQHSDFGEVGVALLRDGLGWIVIPAIALLAGGMLTQLLTRGEALGYKLRE